MAKHRLAWRMGRAKPRLSRVVEAGVTEETLKPEVNKAGGATLPAEPTTEGRLLAIMARHK